MNETQYRGAAAEVADRIRDVLYGFGRADPDALRGLRQVRDWAQAADAELRIRAIRVLEALDDDALRLVASGGINLHNLCIEALARLEAPG